MRVGERERRNRKFVLAVHAQNRTAGDERLDLRRGGEQIGNEWRSGNDLLEIIEDEQEIFRAQKFAERGDDFVFAGLVHAECLRDCRGDEGRVGEGGKHDEMRAVGKFGCKFFGDGNAEQVKCDCQRLPVEIAC